MPLSIFRGRPWPQPGEQLFTEEDTEAVLEYMREKALKCSGCGLPRDETTAKEVMDGFVAEPVRCHACAAIERASNRFHKTDSLPEGIMFAVKRKN